MRVLITGIDGFVGSHMADYLATFPDVEIHGTILFERPSSNLNTAIPRLSLHRVNLTNRQDVLEVVEQVGPDKIIHLAGQAFVPTAIEDPAGTFDVNVLGTVNLLEGARKIKKSDALSLLVVSSGEVYGWVEASRLPVNEECPLSPANPYAFSKVACEQVAMAYRTAYGMNVIIARPFNHAGPRQSTSFVVSDFARRFALFAQRKESAVLAVGNLNMRRDFTDVRDIVHAYWFLVDRPRKEALFNVCSGVPRLIRDVVRILEKITGITPELKQDEARLRAYDLPLLVGSVARLHAATGWLPVIDFPRTVEDTYHWWLSRV
jgi:GDP-4-dehydro-6-deoxy-D-mannose reductase